MVHLSVPFAEVAISFSEVEAAAWHFADQLAIRVGCSHLSNLFVAERAFATAVRNHPMLDLPLKGRHVVVNWLRS